MKVQNVLQKGLVSIGVFVLLSALVLGFPLPIGMQNLEANSNARYEEQISCPKESCLEFNWDESKKADDEIWNAFGKKAGKIAVTVTTKGLKMTDPSLEEHLEYLREISKRGGLVHFEPFYIQTRGFGFGDLPVFKDFLGVALNLYGRLRSYFGFGRMEHYNAKVLYHPVTADIMLIFYFHKHYGSLCDTIYSKCDVIQYLDDQTFDLQLSQRLAEMEKLEKPIEVRFEQTSANLPQFQLDLTHILAVNQSARLYKWLIATKEVETKPVVRQRFLDLSLIVTVIDYTLTAYEMIESILLYKPARKAKAEVTYLSSGEGNLIQAVTFYPAK